MINMNRKLNPGFCEKKKKKYKKKKKKLRSEQKGLKKPVKESSICYKK